jgi:hypothetical protein
VPGLREEGKKLSVPEEKGISCRDEKQYKFTESSSAVVAISWLDI